jgi:coenzyme F420 hydrogenase subunit beta
MTDNSIFCKKRTQGEILLGIYERGYIGYSVDREIRFHAASGGLVTGLLAFALEEGMIEGALVTKFNARMMRPESFIARTREELISGAASKYAPVSIGRTLRKLLQEEGCFAVVGLPCHMQGIRKAEALEENLRNKILLHFGLMCGGTPTIHGTRFLLRILGFTSKELEGLDYREGEWPGNFSITTKHNVRRSIPLHRYSPIIKAFLHPRCLICWDFANEYSDISFGDAFWIKNAKKLGRTAIISRTKTGYKLLKHAEKSDVIRLMDIEITDLIKGKKGNLDLKKNNLGLRTLLFRLLGGKSPKLFNCPSITKFKAAPAIEVGLRFLGHSIINNKYALRALLSSHNKH